MSWQVYIDDTLLGAKPKCVAKAAIFSQDGLQWATSSGFQVTAQEVTTIVHGISVDQTPFHEKGLRLSGEKYTVVRVDPDCRMVYARRGKDAGCCCQLTNRALVIAVYEAGMQAGQCNNRVEKLVDYLKEQKF